MKEGCRRRRRYDGGRRGDSQRLKILYCWLSRWKGPQTGNVLEVRSLNFSGLKSCNRAAFLLEALGKNISLTF